MPQHIHDFDVIIDPHN